MKLLSPDQRGTTCMWMWCSTPAPAIRPWLKLTLEPAAFLEPQDHPDQDQEHAADHDVEVGGVALARNLDVHPPDARDQGERKNHDADRGQHAEDVVEAVRDHRLVGLLERLDH